MIIRVSKAAEENIHGWYEGRRIGKYAPIRAERQAPERIETGNPEAMEIRTHDPKSTGIIWTHRKVIGRRQRMPEADPVIDAQQQDRHQRPHEKRHHFPFKNKQARNAYGGDHRGHGIFHGGAQTQRNACGYPPATVYPVVINGMKDIK